jgi:hypothetical protein
MLKRFATAAGLLLAALATSAEAGPYYGYDGQHYGEVKSAPNYDRSQAKPEGHATRKGGGNRRGLTRAMLALLDRIESRFGPVYVISGYRPGARIATTGRISRHASGNAADIDAGSRKGAIVKWLIANHHSGGTMTYADMGHIHVDIGAHFVSLGAYSGRTGGRGYARSGSRSRYADSDYSRSGYARRYAQRRGSRSHGHQVSANYGQRRYSSGYATIY